MAEECGLDNRDIVDDGSAQALNEADILSLREQARGQDVVGTVVEHSTSFKVKTKYSQEKYINKKKKKHAPVISILKPSTRALCDMYFSKGPSKICHMRVDTVAQILTYSNVHAHCNMIIMETTQGLLLAAMLERMGGFGNLVQVFFGDFPVRLAVDNSSHLSERDRSPLLEYPLQRIGSKFPPVLQSSVLSGINGSTACVGPLEDQDSGGSCEQPDGYEGSRMECSDEEIECQPAKRVRVVSSKRGRWGGEGSDMAEQAGRDIAEGLTGETSTLEKHSLAETITREKRKARRQGRELRYNAAEKLLQQHQMDGLVLACRFHPEPLLMALLGFLAPSRPIVVYCHLLEPLVECYKTLKSSSEDIVFDLQISETWTRHYQVLPERTHPMMSMDGHGGYLLTATTVKRA